MSERSALAGKDAPPEFIEHGGKKYVLRPVLTEGVMLAVEDVLFKRALKALTDMREAMPEQAYATELAALRKRSEDGEFAFESPQTMAFLKTQKGSLILLQAIMDCPMPELLTLVAERGADVQDRLKAVLERSMPKAPQGPKVMARRRR